ncbi:MAG: GTP-binding protein [Planctomycetota bacterium]
MRKIRVILVGGFLGAGKTTLVGAATERLTAQGKRVGLITNDQAANLVDTAALAKPGFPIQEVSGGCFCCRFDDLVAAMERIVETETPDILIGEPVGSCTDLSATVLQPMKQLFAERFDLASFSVLVDATQLRNALQDGHERRFPENVLYIVRKQLQESDVIVLNKADLVEGDELGELQDLLKKGFPQVPVITISALGGNGVDSWLHHVLNDPDVGRTIAEVDYDVYADGEAALGWLNAAVQLQGSPETDWKRFCEDFMEAMQSEFQQSAAEVAHLKFHLTAGDSAITANLTSNREEPSVRGQIEGAPSEARLVMNVRAHIHPAQLRSVTEKCLQTVVGEAIQFVVDDLSSFAPARPEPTHRFGSVL